MAWHDQVIIDQDLAWLAVEHGRETRALAVPADNVNNIPRAPAGIHARARIWRDGKQKSPPDIVDAG